MLHSCRAESGADSSSGFRQERRSEDGEGIMGANAKLSVQWITSGGCSGAEITCKVVPASEAHGGSVVPSLLSALARVGKVSSQLSCPAV